MFFCPKKIGSHLQLPTQIPTADYCRSLLTAVRQRPTLRNGHHALAVRPRRHRHAVPGQCGAPAAAVAKGELKLIRTDHFGMITSNTYRAGTIRQNKNGRRYHFQKLFLPQPRPAGLSLPTDLAGTQLAAAHRLPLSGWARGDLRAGEAGAAIVQGFLDGRPREHVFPGQQFPSRPLGRRSSRIESWRGRVRVFGRHELFGDRASWHYEFWATAKSIQKLRPPFTILKRAWRFPSSKNFRSSWRSITSGKTLRWRRCNCTTFS